MRRIFFASLATVAAIAAVLMACGSSDEGAPATSAPDAGSAGDVASLCTAMCDWKAKCGKGSPTCAQDCNRDTAQYQGKWSARYTGTVASCFSGLACDKKEEDCRADFGTGNEELEAACLRKHEECSIPGAGPDGGTVLGATFSDDLCQTLGALTDQAQTNADACRTKACTQVGDCLKAAGAFTF